MQLIIEIPDALADAVAAQAKEQGLSPDRFVRWVLESTLASALGSGTSLPPIETGYGMLAKYGPAASDKEIDENRRDMFRGFGENF